MSCHVALRSDSCESRGEEFCTSRSVRLGSVRHVTLRILSLLFAATALAGAVIYAQQKAEKSPRINPVFDTSKSGTPTPIDATDEEKEQIRKQNESRKNQGVEQARPEEKWPTPSEPGKKKRKKVMPSSKSYIPDSPE